MMRELPSAAAAAIILATVARGREKRPLKIFILAGQSNMVGMAKVDTIPAIGMDPKTAPLLQDMQDLAGSSPVDGVDGQSFAPVL